jgi:hypothetical protein
MTGSPNNALSLASRAGDLVFPDATSADITAPLTEALAIRTLDFLPLFTLRARGFCHRPKRETCEGGGVGLVMPHNMTRPNRPQASF